MWANGRDDPTVREQCEYADRLDENSLASGIRPGDQNGELVGKQLEAKRDGVIDEGMAPLADLQMPANLRDESIYFDRVASPRAQIIERNAHLPGGGDTVALGPQHIGQLTQHAQHFALLRRFGCAQLIAELDDFGWLDEHGRTRRRFVVDDATDAGAGGAANRNHIAATAHRHRGIGRALGGVELAEDRTQPLHDVLAGFAHVLARACEVARCTIKYGPVGTDRTDERRLELAWRWIDANQNRASRIVRRAETFQIGCGYTHRRECDRQLRECRRFERAP